MEFVSTELKMAANTAAPMLCPKYLENILVPVTTPLFPHSTVDWIPTNKGVVIKPKPAPRVSCIATNIHTGPGNGKNKKLEAPIITMRIPQRAVLRNPIRRYRRPDKADESGQVILMLAKIKPAAIAPTPVTDCAKTGKNILGPIVAIPIPMVARFEPKITRFFQTQLGRIGSSALRSIKIVI